jgi:hypothetical protein
MDTQWERRVADETVELMAGRLVLVMAVQTAFLMVVWTAV